MFSELFSLILVEACINHAKIQPSINRKIAQVSTECT